MAVHVVFVLALLCSAACKPNIVLIISDDMTRNAKFMNIKDAYQVPANNMAELARKGVYFTNAHTCAPACKPSRTCLLFSLSPKITNVRRNEVSTGFGWCFLCVAGVVQSSAALCCSYGHITAPATYSKYNIKHVDCDLGTLDNVACMQRGIASSNTLD